MELYQLLSVATVLGHVMAQLAYDCPDGWYSNNGFCYRFQSDLPAKYDDARASCNLNGAGVLSVDNLEEHSYISQWMQKNDPFQQQWYTSGVRVDTSNTNINLTSSGFSWESTGHVVENFLMPLFIAPPDPKLLKGVIIYTYGALGPGWLFVDGSIPRPYICKIATKEAYRIVQTNRGYDYGIEDADMENLEFGPYFIQQPNSVVVVSLTEPLTIECIAQGNPPPVYKWYRGANYNQEVNENLDPRYSITNGKLTIVPLNDIKDTNTYRCSAENKFGTIVSNSVDISFGYLGEFNNVQDAGTRGKAFEGATVECSKINYKPAIVYTWIKNGLQFVRPEFQTYIFISRNGKLYFSEITQTDEGTYTCIVSLAGVNQFTVGSSQPPSRNSLPIPLIVDAQTPQANWGPIIQNDFISVFPSTPLAGQDVRLECFAYGSSTSPFTYTWAREDKPMSENAMIMDSNRVLVIPQAQLEDSGVYRCTVSRGASASDTKTFKLTLGARPYFISQLQNQHADIDSQLTWICNARGSPTPVYSWYKNGIQIDSDVNKRLRIQQNVLTISQLDPDLHNGMYQCGATNSHGVSITAAQLRVLAFRPNLRKFPPPQTLTAPKDGNVTIRCQPEGSPFPKIEWSKDKSPITSDGSKYTIFGNGNLLITYLTTGDRGVYTCTATNTYGQVNASTTLDIAGGAAITMAPSDITVVVNQTAFLVCEASFPANIDIMYEWTFNGFPLFLEEVYYRQVQDTTAGGNGLYVVNAQFRHEGKYTCTVRTPFNYESRSAYLTIKGPPKQPAGVHTMPDSTTSNSTIVAWTQGFGSGGTISVHIIQASNEYEPEWIELNTLTVAETFRQNDLLENKHSAVVEGLNPGTGYKLRIIAQNEYGRGEPSDPSPIIQTRSAAPAVAPRNLRGGGGSVGDLTIVWDPLHRSEYGAKTVRYKIYWRPQQTDSLYGGLWRVEIVTDPLQDHLVKLVGVENYFLPYDVMIQAFNEMGFGPNSSVAEVFSADGIPIAIPMNVNTLTINVSAIQVWWDPIPDDRENARGTILGYQINYWNEEEDPAIYTQSIRYYGNVGEGKVIGLPNDINAVVDVQMYNRAGLGPRSNTYIMETSSFPPLNYPEEVRVSSAGANSVHVWYRGLTITYLEEDITGYYIYIWTATENPRSARIVEVPIRTFEWTVRNITNDRIYALRVAGNGKGGTGKKSPTMYFTLEGQILVDSSFAQTIDVYLSPAVQLQPSRTILLLLFTLICILCSLLE